MKLTVDNDHSASPTHNCFQSSHPDGVTGFLYRQLNVASCLLLLCLLTGTGGLAQTAKPDSVNKNSVYVLPFVSYQQETALAPGIGFGYYFKSDDSSRVSSVTGSAVYTFLNQFSLNVAPRVFFNHSKWYLYSTVNLQNYPDYYFGIAKNTSEIKQAYTEQSATLLLQPQYRVSKFFMLGPLVAARLSKVNQYWLLSPTEPGNLTAQTGAGWEPYSLLSAGVVATYDSRDNQFYPYRGMFVKLSASASKAGWGSSYSLQQLRLDYRQFLSLFQSHVLAWQLYGIAVYGKAGIPFELLPSPGGSDLLRGFRKGQYRDNVMWTAQTEYRIPVYKRVKAAVFCSVGDVLNSSDYRTDKLMLSYGAGLRYRLNDARVHLRLDVAQNNYGDKLQLYFAVSDAF